MKRIKAIFYNSQVNYIIMVIFAIACLMYIILINDQEKILHIIIIIMILYVFLNFVISIKRNHNLKYLKLNYPLFYKKRVWINQKSHISKKRDMNKCPQMEFAKELNTILKKINTGTICYCCTHEDIKKHIYKKKEKNEISFVTDEEAFRYDLIKLKKKIKIDKCDTCNSKTCTLFESNNEQLYSIKFIK